MQATWLDAAKNCWGGAVRGSEGHPADDDDLASEKGHLLAKRTLFSMITRGQLPPAPLLGTALSYARYVTPMNFRSSRCTEM